MLKYLLIATIGFIVFPVKADTPPPPVAALQDLVKQAKNAVGPVVLKEKAQKGKTAQVNLDQNVYIITCKINSLEDLTRRPDRSFEVDIKKSTITWVQNQIGYSADMSYSSIVFFDETSKYVLNRLDGQLNFIEKNVVYHGLCQKASKPIQLI